MTKIYNDVVDRMHQDQITRLRAEVEALKDNQQYKDDKHVAMGVRRLKAYNNILQATGKLLQENTKLRAELSLVKTEFSTKEIEDEQRHLEHRSTPVSRLVAGELQPQPQYDSMVGRQDLER